MILHSIQDKSVNFVEEKEGGYFESRYVNRDNGYFICYLSSHIGCNQQCKMCHLTKTGQVKMRPATLKDYKTQAEKVFQYAKDKGKVHINFMARGEPLLNQGVVSGEVFNVLEKLCRKYDLRPEFNISTIFPSLNCQRTFKYFGIHTPTLYYSYYSSNPIFRKTWLPNAAHPVKAFDFLTNYYMETGIESKIHFALIKEENDSKKDMEDLVYWVNKLPYKPQINFVRYNSPDDSEESEKISEYTQFLLDNTRARVYTVPRVGFDVKASCGMFVGEK